MASKEPKPDDAQAKAAAAAKAEAEEKAKAEAREQAEAAEKEKALAEENAKAEAQKKADEEVARRADEKAKAAAAAKERGRPHRIRRIDQHGEVSFFSMHGDFPGWNADPDKAYVFDTADLAEIVLADHLQGDGDLSVQPVDA
ncbi:hypothetical protein [Ancylobacter amanitiformis]|uniref:Flagellar biosynthesis GTPase FlhF n=1 Tax=Ancylobacter amanitiformis TaxID=217069 RepID=A0ABU0LQA8_9HYPH|nr:hypothetical protein [Ancylobacter amanitiformis]MDQ0510889.1 flagellar biosynthesis GTPase FlhF [Ancylobacter amanitiformis]